MKTNAAGLELIKGHNSTLRDRFLAKIKLGGQDECWEWQAKAKTSFGYGRMSAGRRSHLKAHRVSWQIFNGDIPSDMIVCHKCDNPVCCNPNHLFLGTKADNTHDMMRKGRMKPPPVRFGERHHNATIPDSELVAIRASKLPRRQLADKYGVSYKTIYRIQTGKSRAHEN